LRAGHGVPTCLIGSTAYLMPVCLVLWLAGTTPAGLRKLALRHVHASVAHPELVVQVRLAPACLHSSLLQAVASLPFLFICACPGPGFDAAAAWPAALTSRGVMAGSPPAFCALLPTLLLAPTLPRWLRPCLS
jgi:hypothetical protein